MASSAATMSEPKQMEPRLVVDARVKAPVCVVLMVGGCVRWFDGGW